MGITSRKKITTKNHIEIRKKEPVRFARRNDPTSGIIENPELRHIHIIFSGRLTLRSQFLHDSLMIR